MRWFILVIIAYLVLFLGIAIAFVDQAFAATCAPWAQMQRALAEQYGEGVLFVGRNDRADVDVVVAGAAQGTWSAVVRKADGTACLLATGDAWAMSDPTLTPPPLGMEN